VNVNVDGIVGISQFAGLLEDMDILLNIMIKKTENSQEVMNEYEEDLDEYEEDTVTIPL
jgi:hypothetical protein